MMFLYLGSINPRFELVGTSEEVGFPFRGWFGCKQPHFSPTQAILWLAPSVFLNKNKSNPAGANLIYPPPDQNSAQSNNDSLPKANPQNQ